MIGRGDAQTLRITTVRHDLSDLVERKPRRFDTGLGSMSTRATVTA